MLKTIGWLCFTLIVFANVASASAVTYQIESFDEFDSLNDPANLLSKESTAGISGSFTIESTTPALLEGEDAARFENPIRDVSISFGGVAIAAENITSSSINQYDVDGYWTHYSMEATFDPVGDLDSVTIFVQIDAQVYDHRALGENVVAIDSSFYGVTGFRGGDSFVMEGQQVQLAAATADATAVVPVPAAVWLFGSGLIGLIGILRSKNVRITRRA